MKTDEKYQCDICAKQKTYKRTQLKEAEASVDRPGVIVSVDYIGDYKKFKSYGDYKGAYVFIDWYSKHLFVYSTKTKSTDDFLRCFQRFQLESGMRTLNLEIGPSILQSDSGSEILSNTAQDYLTDHGIRSRTSPPGVQAQNGMVERHIRTLKEMTKSLLTDSGLSEKYWVFAAKHAAVILSLCADSNSKTPYELQFGIPPPKDLMLPGKFGSKTYAYDIHYPNDHQIKSCNVVILFGQLKLLKIFQCVNQ